MVNPFSELGKGKPKPYSIPDFEEWGGVFSCQANGCYEVATVAKYFRAVKVLSWECPKGHHSQIEDFED